MPIVTVTSPTRPMRQILKNLTKMVAGYGIIQWAGPFLSFFFTPIITRILTPDDYGIADYITTVSTAVATIALFAVPQAVAAHFNDKHDVMWQRQVAGSAFTLTALIGVLVGGVFFLSAPWLANLAPITHGYEHLFQLIGSTLVFGLCGAVLSSAAQAALKVRFGMLLSLTSILFTVFGNVFYIVILRLGVTGMLLTPVTLSIALFTVALLVMRPMIGKPTREIIVLLLHTGAILVPSTLAAWGLQVADRLILAQYVTAESMGHYAIANKIATLLYVAIGPLFTAYTPLALSMQHDPLARDRYAIISRYLVSAVLIAGLGLGLFATEILIIFTRTAYLPAATYVGFLAYIHIFGAINMILTTGGLAGKQFSGIAWTVVVGAVVNILLNLVLIPRFELWGATIATFIGYAIPPVLLYFWLQNRYRIPYPAKQILAAVTVQIGLLIVGLYVPPVGLAVRVGLKSLILILLPIALFPLGIISRYEVEQMKQFVRIRLENARLQFRK